MNTIFQENDFDYDKIFHKSWYYRNMPKQGFDSRTVNIHIPANSNSKLHNISPLLHKAKFSAKKLKMLQSLINVMLKKADSMASNREKTKNKRKFSV